MLLQLVGEYASLDARALRLPLDDLTNPRLLACVEVLP